MSVTSFFTSFLPQRRPREPKDLPLPARIASLESDVLSMQIAVDSLQTSLRKLSGKVYRGIALGDTTEAAAAPVEGEPPPQLMTNHVQSKAGLYARAAQLRMPR